MKRDFVTATVMLLVLAGAADAGKKGPPVVFATANSSGTGSNGCSFDGCLSANGRILVFDSDASDMVPGDVNGECDLFARDLKKGTLVPVAVSLTGGFGNQGSYEGAVTANGRFVAFQSDATDLVEGDTNGNGDVFVRDLKSNAIDIVSVSSEGVLGDRSSHASQACISDNGRWVVFSSPAENLVANDTNEQTDVFVHDRVTGETVRVSVSSTGTEADASSSHPVISGNGRFVAFASSASNLVDDDTNDRGDIFVHDMKTGETRIISRAEDGTEANGNSYGPSLDKKGRFCAFASDSSNLTADDDNTVNDVFVVDLKKSTLVRASRSHDGSTLTQGASSPCLSAKGRHLAFTTRDAAIVPGDTNGQSDMFVVDLKKGTVVLASVDQQADPLAGGTAGRDRVLSANGKVVALEVDDAIDAADENGDCDVYVVDLKKAARVLKRKK